MLSLIKSQKMSMSSVIRRCSLGFLALPLVSVFLSILLAGCLLGRQPQLLSIKAGEVVQKTLRCNNSSDPTHQEIIEKPFWVMITDGEGTLRAKYRVFKKGHQGSVIAQGLTPNTVSLLPSGKYVVEVTHPVSDKIYTKDIGTGLIIGVGFLLTPSRVLAGFSADQNPVDENSLQDQYTYQRGGKVVLAGGMVEKCS